jgi:CcmD family protein
MTSSEKYVAAAYLVVFSVVLLYVVIMATKLARLERDVSELIGGIRGRATQREPDGSERAPSDAAQCAASGSPRLDEGRASPELPPLVRRGGRG